MKTVELVQDGEAVRIVVVSADGKSLAEHVVHAVGPSPSLANLRGGPGIASSSPLR